MRLIESIRSLGRSKSDDPTVMITLEEIHDEMLQAMIDYAPANRRELPVLAAMLTPEAAAWRNTIKAQDAMRSGLDALTMAGVRKIALKPGKNRFDALVKSVRHASMAMR